MFRIKAYTSDSQIKNIDLILPIIQNQMEFIGSSKSLEQTKQTLLHAMKPVSRAVLFVGYNKNDVPIAFAFGNIGVGLEAGDYFWLNEIHVDASCRRIGYASTFLTWIENWLKKKNIYYFATMTGDKNIPSQYLFKKNGFNLDNIIWIDKELNQE